LKALLLIALIPGLMIACERGHKRNPVAAASEAAKDPDLQKKTWQAECSNELKRAIATGVASGFQAAVKSSRQQFKFSGNNMTLVTTYYIQQNCAEEAWQFEESGTFKIDKDKKSNDGGTNIDFDLRELTLRVISQSGSVAANGINLCDKKDWAANSKKMEVNKPSKNPTCYAAEVPRKIPNIYRIDGDSLVLGSPGATVAERPAKLDFTVRFSGK